MAFRLTDGASTLQAELGGTLKALQHCLRHNQESNIAIISAAMSSLLLLQHPSLTENRLLCSAIAVALRQIRQQGRSVEML